MRATLFGAAASKHPGRFRLPAVARGAAPALLPHLTREEQQSLLMLLAPFLIVASSLAGQQILRTAPPPRPDTASLILPAAVPVPVLPARPPAVAIQPIASTPPTPSIGVAPPLLPSAVPAPRATTALRRSEPPAPALSGHERAARLAALKPTVRLEPLSSEMLRPVPPPVAALRLPEPADSATADPQFSPPTPLPHLASLAPMPAPTIPAPALPITVPLETPAPSAPPVVVPAPATPMPVPAALAPLAVCQASPAISVAHFRGLAAVPGRFGHALAAAAHEQLGDLVIYNARYARLKYPMGDVANLYGVCTDVVIRAYRALGIDLQELIFTTKSGRGDIHIDHRRVEVVRKFLEKHGETLPVTDFAEDFKPGDIVTYYRPQNRSSTTHIAVVSDKLAPSGRLMIIHNRGWGPQLEDALFVDKITGHYRFSGLRDRKPIRAPSLPQEGIVAQSRLLERTAWFVRGMSKKPDSAEDSTRAATVTRHALSRAVCLPAPGETAGAAGLTAARPAVPAQAKPKATPTRTAAAATTVR